MKINKHPLQERISKASISHVVECNEQHNYECCRLGSNHQHKPHTGEEKKKEAYNNTEQKGQVDRTYYLASIQVY